MDLIVFKKDSAEWGFIWQWLEEHPINEGLEEPRVALHEGEAWQYMSSYSHDNKILHEVRHRNHPKTNKLEVLVFNGSDNFNEDQIELRKSIN